MSALVGADFLRRLIPGAGRSTQQGSLQARKKAVAAVPAIRYRCKQVRMRQLFDMNGELRED
jgi:hypothetical protein